MRATALGVDQYRRQRKGLKSEWGCLWGWFVIRRLGYDLRVMSSGPTDPEGNPWGWEHVSVSRSDGRIPTWADMCHVKDLFWAENETVLQFHPDKAEYVNVHPGCLHLWKKAGENHPLPPRELLA